MPPPPTTKEIFTLPPARMSQLSEREKVLHREGLLHIVPMQLCSFCDRHDRYTTPLRSRLARHLAKMHTRDGKAKGEAGRIWRALHGTIDTLWEEYAKSKQTVVVMDEVVVKIEPVESENATAARIDPLDDEKDVLGVKCDEMVDDIMVKKEEPMEEEMLEALTGSKVSGHESEEPESKLVIGGSVSNKHVASSPVLMRQEARTTSDTPLPKLGAKYQGIIVTKPTTSRLVHRARYTTQICQDCGLILGYNAVTNSRNFLNKVRQHKIICSKKLTDPTLCNDCGHFLGASVVLQGKDKVPCPKCAKKGGPVANQLNMKISGVASVIDLNPLLGVRGQGEVTLRESGSATSYGHL